jgi:molybdopterin synthase catalytic subunit
MIERWIDEVKKKVQPEMLGMIAIHHGLVRATSKDGRRISRMRLSYDKDRLSTIVQDLKRRDGIGEIMVWINEGELSVGDDIMYVLVAGRFRQDVFPVLERLVGLIKSEVVKEEELEMA